MKILFFSHLYNNGFSHILTAKEKRLPGVAVSNYENGFLKALEKLTHSLEIVNREFYPRCFEQDFNAYEKKQYSLEIELSTKKYQDMFFCKKIKSDDAIKEQIKRADVVFFSTYHDWRIYKYVKKMNPSIKSILLLPDLPDFIVNKSSLKHKLSKKLSSMFFYKNCKYIDGAIPITDHMSGHLSKWIQNRLTIEGVAKECDIQNINRNNYSNTIVYSGGLARKYGILELIDAFKNIKEASNYKLIICGRGECEKQVLEESKINSSIIYNGFMPRNEVLELLSHSAFLVVPERNTNEYSKYSFHSKIIEYLGSGTPTIAYLYDGMPSEYKDYILPIEGNGLDLRSDLESAFKSYLTMKKEDNIEFGKKSRDFISNRLSVKKIANVIDDFIRRICE